ncbi:MAG: hypothetical protein ABIP01_05085 [Candidatus Limnocylindria bacterium]
MLIGGGPDLSLVPAFMVLFATGISGFYIRLGGRSRQLGMGGLAFAGVAALAGLVALGYQAQRVAPEDLDAPFGVTIAYVLGTFGILAALLLFGLATHRAAMLPRGWRAVPLIAGVIWFPLEGLTAVLPDGWGLFADGLAWLAAGFSLVPAAAAAGAFALLSGAAYVAYFVSFEVLGEWLISAWNLLILPPAVYLGAVLWRRKPWVALSATAAGIAASVLWAFGFHNAALEPWWIGLAAAWWLGTGWLLRAQWSRLGWFTVALGVAAAVDYLLTALKAPMPLYALGGFKIPMTMVWSLWPASAFSADRWSHAT